MTQDKAQKITLPIKGLHCRSCELLLEDKFSSIKHVVKSDINYRKGTAEIFYSGDKPEVKELEEAVISAGYKIGESGKESFFSHEAKDYKELILALVIVAIAYGILKISGVTELINIGSENNEAGFGMAVLVGLVAGFSSCMALVGGLILGMSAKHAEAHPEATAAQKFRPHLFFNAGRISGYAIFGGLLGALGSIFQLSTSITSVMTILAGALMLFVGLQLINIFPKLSSFNFTLPKSVSKLFGLNKHHSEYNYKNAMIVGALTFFLPCGFTQAMQVYAVSTGSFWSGALIMALFAIGTAPGLLSVGGLTSALKGSAGRKFFKIAGVVVIAFAFFNFSNGLALAGLITKGGNEKLAEKSYQDPNVQMVDGVQVVKMKELKSGYSPNKFTIKKGVPVKWVIDAQAPNSCAASLVLPKLSIRKNLKAGENIITFTPKEVGKLPFSCSMGMYTGVFYVVDETGVAPSATELSSDANISSNGTCGSPQSGGGCGASSGSCGSKSGGCGASSGPAGTCSGAGNCSCGGAKKIDTSSSPIKAKTASSNTAIQKISSTFTVDTDIQPNTFEVKVGQAVEYTIDVKEDGAGCMWQIMIPELYETPVALKAGEKIVMNFTPKTKGVYDITCGMGMVRGLINVGD